MFGGFAFFRSVAGIHGLAIESDDVLTLLSVKALAPGTGQFRAFIDTTKDAFQTIHVLDVWNRDLAAMLIRYGFKRTKVRHGRSIVRGYEWIRPSPNATPQDPA